jgi:hypothetical protein
VLGRKHTSGEQIRQGGRLIVRKIKIPTLLRNATSAGQPLKL